MSKTKVVTVMDYLKKKRPEEYERIIDITNVEKKEENKKDAKK